MIFTKLGRTRLNFCSPFKKKSFFKVCIGDVRMKEDGLKYSGLIDDYYLGETSIVSVKTPEQF